MPRKHTCAQCGQVFHALGHILDHANEFVNGKCLNVIEKDKNSKEESSNTKLDNTKLDNTKLLDYNKLLNESTNTIVSNINNNKIKV